MFLSRISKYAQLEKFWLHKFDPRPRALGRKTKELLWSDNVIFCLKDLKY